MKPTLSSIQSTIKNLRNLCEEHNVKKLAMPRIGCGLDRLNWDDVKYSLNCEFQHSNIEVVVYHYVREVNFRFWLLL